MLSEKLLNAYSAENYEKQSTAMQAVLKSYLEINTTDDNAKTTKTTEPNQEYDFWKTFVADDESHLFHTLVDRSIKLHNRKYIGHQVAVPLPITAVISEMTALLNNGMAVYEMGAAATAIEKVVIDQLKPYFGYDDGADGFFTSGGSIANLTAMLCARSSKIEISWMNGTQYNQYAILVSDQAHYCIERAVKIMGWGEHGCIKIPVDSDYKIRTDLLNEYYEEATSRGVKIIGIVGSAPSTSTGMYDDLATLGHFAKKYNLWYHVDAAHGGPAAFTEKYRHLLEGIEVADSITIDCHKMMMTPALTTMLLFKKGKDSYSTFSQQAQYLWADQQEEWHNLGKRTIECTKLMMAMRVYAILNVYGLDIVSEYVTHTYDMARWMAKEIGESTDFELAVSPDSNIVCFRYTDCPVEIVDDINNAIRRHLITEGYFYIVQTKLKGNTFLRTSIMNALTLQSDLSDLLGKIRFLGQLCQ
jgi:L-2,4-diaminobutyrate decarboxylase